MPFLLLVFLSLACLPEPGRDWPEAPWGPSPWLGVIFTALGVAFGVFSAWVISRRARRVLSPNPIVAEAALSRYESGRVGHQYLLIGLYVVSLLGFGWGNA